MTTAPFQVAVVGCGIGGLAAAIGITSAGHKVTIFERASKLAQVGAGIQIGPNTTGILKQWGLLTQIVTHSVEPQHLKLRAYHDGAVISASQIDPQMKMVYGVPYLAIHRANLAQVLFEKTETLGVRTRFGAKISEIDPLRPSIKLVDGEQFDCDLILGADGLHSMCRELIPGQAQEPFFPGDVAFRIVLPKSDLIESRNLVELTQSPAVHIFMGPDAHVVLYPLKGGQGAAQAIEDGAFLGALFETIKDPHDIKGALQLYETIRKPRTSVIVQKSIENRELFNMKDGPGQHKRDEMLKQRPLSLTEFQKWLYGYDAIALGKAAAQTFKRHESGMHPNFLGVIASI
ncbi:hypothetical protein MMC27_006232 [Xylographa pallens]|nr:hypothetical protein [Xylographa pallens]